ncbi:HSP70-domain-containing protein [Thozetella sp. PMI_491]|nr:HSP70-domain-containing protein [Thozetella sp. PMI_491]
MGATGRRRGACTAFAICLACIVCLVFIPVVHSCGDSDPDNEGSYIAIDFGLQHTRVAVLREGTQEILPSEQATQFSPSYIAFTEHGTLFGEAARLHAAVDPTNTVFGIRNLLGRSFSAVQAQTRQLPFKVISKDDRPVVQVEVAGRIQQYTPEELYGMILTRIKNTTEMYLDSSVSTAVMTVPAFFDDAQREATRKAAGLAGIYAERLVNEPTAAGIGHGLDREFDELWTLVFGLDDTLSIHLIEIDQGVFEILGQANGLSPATGECDAAGQDCLDRFYELEPKNRESAGGISGTENASFVMRLFDQSIMTVDKMLRNANMSKELVNALVFTGASENIPELQALAEEYFGIKASNVTTPADSKLLGAARQAQILSSDMDVDWISSVIEINPLSVGLQTPGGLMTRLLGRNNVLPRLKKQNFTTAADNQTSMSIRLYAGERALTRHNIFLGEFELAIPPLPRRNRTVEVAFLVDEDLMLTATARDLASGEEETVRVPIYPVGGWNSELIEYMVFQAEDYWEQDQVYRQFLPNVDEIEGKRLVSN